MKTTAHLVRAGEAVQQADRLGAAERDVYAWTMALRHLEKAREEAHRGQHATAETLAREAETWAHRAMAEEPAE